MKPAIPARVNPYGQPDGEGKFKPATLVVQGAQRARGTRSAMILKR
jgi:hypothetical protein